MEISGWVLVAGFGSIGRRHFRNLRALGLEDVRLLRSGRTPVAGFETPPGVTAYTHLEAALADKPRVVIIANPTSLHVETARTCLRQGASVVMEKPVGVDLANAQALSNEVHASGAICNIAYCFRYHPLYSFLHSVVEDGILGRIFHARGWQAQFLPDWHPWEDYRSGYAARAELGGGVVRTLDHELDMLRWLLGEPSSVLASVGSLSGLGLEVEDVADMTFRWADDRQAHVHVSFAHRGYDRGWSLSGEGGSALLDWASGSVTVRRGQDLIDHFRLPGDYDLNQMYLDTLHHALERMCESPAVAAIDLSEGVAALKLADAALNSSRLGVAVEL